MPHLKLQTRQITLHMPRLKRHPLYLKHLPGSRLPAGVYRRTDFNPCRRMDGLKSGSADERIEIRSTVGGLTLRLRRLKLETPTMKRRPRPARAMNRRGVETGTRGKNGGASNDPDHPRVAVAYNLKPFRQCHLPGLLCPAPIAPALGADARTFQFGATRQSRNRRRSRRDP